MKKISHENSTKIKVSALEGVGGSDEILSFAFENSLTAKKLFLKRQVK